jgi:hypothetical protein
MTHIVAVTSYSQRDMLMHNILKNLEHNKEDNIDVQKVNLNKINIYQKAGPGVRALIKTVLIVVVQIHVNTAPLLEIYDEQLRFDLSALYREMNACKEKLDKISTTVARRRFQHEQKFARLVTSLSDISD